MTWVLAALVGAAWSAEPPASINELHQHERTYVGPFPERLEAIAARFGGTVDADRRELPETGVAVLYGDASSNPLLGEVLARHRIALAEDHVQIGEHRLPIPSPFLIVALPGEGAGDGIVAYTAFDRDVQSHLNRVFHGPTPLVVGSTEGGQLTPVFAGGYRLDAEGRLSGLDVAPAELTGVQLAEDVEAVSARLVRGYGGLGAVSARLAEQGSTWEAHVEASRSEALAQPSWTFPDAWRLIVRLLDPVEDAHFALTGAGLDEQGLPGSYVATTLTPWRAWFAEGRLRRRGGGWSWGDVELAEAPPVVPEPADAVLGEVYRFPTVGSDGEEAFLVGRFAPQGEEPVPIELGGASWPLHRPPSLSERTAAWSVSEEPAPVLAVRTMVASQLDGLRDTARELRRARSLILDLRSNGGGSDRPAIQWVRRFSPMAYRWHGSSDVAPGDGPQAPRTTDHAPSTLSSRGRPYRGRLWVLVDDRVASSGETFAMLASQIPGAIRVGTNTMGCTEVGNVAAHEPLPHTRLVARFGRTAFHVDQVVPIAEGRGMFPDLWLDEADPIGLLSDLPKTAGRAVR